MLKPFSNNTWVFALQAPNTSWIAAVAFYDLVRSRAQPFRELVDAVHRRVRLIVIARFADPFYSSGLRGEYLTPEPSSAAEMIGNQVLATAPRPIRVLALVN